MMAVDKTLRSQIGLATSLYEKRKKIELLKKLWDHVNQADKRLFRKRFQFQGNPIPSSSNAIEQLGVSPQDVPTAHVVGDLQNESILLSSLSHTVLRDISHCEIGSKSPIPSAHVDGALDIVLALDSEGAVSVRNTKDSHLVINCHQLRLHDLENCTVWAEVANDRIIIENCRNITFGGYDHVTGTLQIPSFEVDDFDWPTRRIASPNYAYVSSGRWEIGSRIPVAKSHKEWGKDLRSFLSLPRDSGV